MSAGPLTLRTPEGEQLSFDVTETLPEVEYFVSTFDNFSTVCFVLPDDGGAGAGGYRFRSSTVMARDYRFVALIDLHCPKEQALGLVDGWYDATPAGRLRRLRQLGLRLRRLPGGDGGGGLRHGRGLPVPGHPAGRHLPAGHGPHPLLQAGVRGLRGPGDGSRSCARWA